MDLLTYSLLQHCLMLCALSCEFFSKQLPWAAAAPLFNSKRTFYSAFCISQSVIICLQVSSQPYCMAPTCCDLVQRAQALIKASFQGVGSDFISPLKACLKAAQQAPPSPPGGYYAPQWPEQGCLSTSSQLGSISRSTGGSSRSYVMRKRARLGRVR